MSNGWGSARDTKEHDFHVFDRMPPPIREAQRQAVACWSARGLEKLLHEAFEITRSRREAIVMVIGIMRRAEEQDTWRTYGPDHPQANAYGRKLKPARNACWSPKGRRR